MLIGMVGGGMGVASVVGGGMAMVGVANEGSWFFWSSCSKVCTPLHHFLG
jgi:hypothetical protein